jgi:hypothetical protein
VKIAYILNELDLLPEAVFAQEKGRQRKLIATLIEQMTTGQATITPDQLLLPERKTAARVYTALGFLALALSVASVYFLAPLH